MSEKAPLTEMITKEILKQITNGEYRQTKRLPPEKEIAARVGASRTAVRDALAVLEREGFISRKQGFGTIINHHVIEITNRMDLEREFCEEVRACGFQPETKMLDARQVPAGKSLGGTLQIEPDGQVFAITRLIYADARPAIYCIDYFAADLVVRQGYTEKDLEQPIFYFLEKFCDQQIHMDITEIRALAANVEVARRLELPFATPVLYMAELGYDFCGKPVLFSKEYYVDGMIRHTLLRKKI